VIAGKSHGEMGHPIAMTPVKDGKGLGIPLVNQGDQVCVAARILNWVLQRNRTTP
jgi:hypothetical protein